MKDFFKKMAPGFLGSLIIFTIGIIVTISKEKKSTQKRYIDCFEHVQFNGIDSSDLKEERLQILHKGKAITGFSNINVGLYNFSDKDAGNIKVLVEIKPQKSDSLELIFQKVAGPQHLSSTIKTIHFDTATSINGSLRFEYHIETANRADSVNDAILDANFQIASKLEPTLTVIIEGVGLNKVSYSRDHFEKLSWFEKDDNAFICFFIAGCILFLIVFIKVLNYLTKKENERWKIYLFNKLNEKINGGNLNYDAKSIIDEYRSINEQFAYEDTSKFMKKLKRLKPPTE